MNRLWTIMRKEVFHIWRDPRTLAMIVVLPALLLVLLGFGISFEQQSVKMAVADFSKTDSSRNFIEQFTASKDFVYAYDVSNEVVLIDLIQIHSVSQARPGECRGQAARDGQLVVNLAHDICGRA